MAGYLFFSAVILVFAYGIYKAVKFIMQFNNKNK